MLVYNAYVENGKPTHLLQTESLDDGNFISLRFVTVSSVRTYVVIKQCCLYAYTSACFSVFSACMYITYSTRQIIGAHSLQFLAICTSIARLRSTRLNGIRAEWDGSHVRNYNEMETENGNGNAVVHAVC